MYSEQDVSIVVPAYNIKERLTRLVGSLEKQVQDPGSFETIIVDDGSSDGTKEYLQAYRGPLDLKYVLHQTNRGRSAARNSGINVATRNLILFLDGDVIASPDLVTRHVSFHTDGNRTLVGGVRYSKEFGANGFTRYLETRGVMRGQSTGKILPRYFLSGHSSVPLIAVQKVGGFDETIEYGEDIDFGIRLAQAGLEIYGNPSLSVVHQHVRTIEDAAKVTESFGFKALPVLSRRYPALKNDLKLEVFEKSGIKAGVLRFFFMESIFKLILRLASISPAIRLPSVIYSYILYRSYLVGFGKNLK